MQRVTFSVPWPFTAEQTRSTLLYVLRIALFSHLIFFFLETFQPGFVSFYINTNLFLYVSGVVGALAYAWPVVVPAARKTDGLDWKTYAGLAILCTVIAVAIAVRTQPLGWIGLVIAITVGLAVFGLGLLVYFDDSQ